MPGIVYLLLGVGVLVAVAVGELVGTGVAVSVGVGSAVGEFGELPAICAGLLGLLSDVLGSTTGKPTKRVISETRKRTVRATISFVLGPDSKGLALRKGTVTGVILPVLLFLSKSRRQPNNRDSPRYSWLKHLAYDIISIWILVPDYERS